MVTRLSAQSNRLALQSCDTLTGAPVVDRRRAVLGSVEELLLELETGRVAFAVLSLAATASASPRLVAVPWSWLRFDTGNQRFELLREGGLERAATLASDQWPDFTDLRWQRRLREHYAHH
jgi:hypothetical protein